MPVRFQVGGKLSAMVLSSPGCSMKEFVDKTSLVLPADNTIAGLHLRHASTTSCGVKWIC
jgi:hypothetical protein